MKRPMAWSFSRLSMFEQCPLLFQHTHILKTLKFVSNAAMERGKKLHKQLERNVIRAEHNKAPVGDDVVIATQPIIKNFVAAHQGIMVEQQIAFTRKMRQTDWFNDNVWLRIVADLVGQRYDGNIVTAAALLDWKTGQYQKTASDDQLRINNLGLLYLMPTAQTASSAFVYIDHKKTSPITTTYRSELPALLEEFEDRSEAIQIAVEKDLWPAQRNYKCKWCKVDTCRYVGR